MTPDLSAQFRTPVLDMTAGVHGYRVAFVGGPVFDVVDDPMDPNGSSLHFPTLQSAGAAYRAAVLAGDEVMKIRASHA